MRARFRGVIVALMVAGALAACQRQSAPSAEDNAPAAPSNAEREAEIASEQLAALGGRANAAQRAAFEGEYQASGAIDGLGSAEGAWELTLLEDYAQLSRPGLGEDGGLAGEREYHERGMRVVAGPLTITIRQEACTASGVEVPYVAHVLFEGVAYQGCARRGVDAGARPTWASVLPELMPAIDACLARIGGGGTRVTFATLLDEGEVSVRVRDSNGTRRVCTATNAGENARVEHLSDIDTARGEGDPEFQRGDTEPRRQNCRVNEQALGRDGEVLGWLVRRSGC